MSSEERARSVEGNLRLDADRVVLDRDSGEVLTTAESASELWSWAQGARVIARLREVDGKSMIDTLRASGDGSLPYREVGPVETLRGTLVVETGAPATKLAGVERTFFDGDDGKRYGVLGGSVPPVGAQVTAHVRRLAADMSYTARETRRRRVLRALEVRCEDFCHPSANRS